MATSTLRSWKLQEFTAHESNVNCLALGHMSGRVLVTGGYDRKVNLWAIGTNSCILSLNAHQSPVECVKFGHTEEFVCSGSQAGELTIWDLEADKKVRTFSGHKDAIKCLDFHPYGDFLASGSLDTTIKLWDLRRKGCLSSYKGHTLTVNRVRFSPDGIWMASAGEDGTVKLWDVRVGRRLAELTDHEAAVLTVEFHPHEFLLASGSMDRKVQFWDLENFQPVSNSKQDSGPIRCLRFSPEGHCLYAGVEDHLKVFAWEPGRLLDSVNTGWGQIQDMVQTTNQLVGASFYKSKVSLMTVDLKAVRTKPEPVLAVPAGPAFPARSASVRKSFSKEKLIPGAFTVKRNCEDSERSGGDTEEERADSMKPFHPQRTLNRTPPPVPEISHEPDPEQDRSLPVRYDTPTSEPEPLSLSSLDSNPRSYPKDYNRPYRAHSPQPRASSPQNTGYTPQPVAYSMQPTTSTPRSPSPKQQQQTSPLKTRRHSTSEQRKPLLPEKPKHIGNKLKPVDAENEFPTKMNNIRHSPSEPSLAKAGTSTQSRFRKGSLNTQSDTPLSARQTVPGSGVNAVTPVNRPVSRPVLPVRPSPAPSPAYFTPPQSLSKLELPPEEVSDRLSGINIEDFLPKNANRSTPYAPNIESNTTELEAFNSLMSVHSSIMLALSSRQRNLQLVFSMWHTKDMRIAIESAVGMSDPGIIADLLGVMILKPASWTLDICNSVLPSIEELLQSKYEAYMTIGCTALSLILRNFAQIIKSNILAPVHTMGVDISREERYNKSLRCYQNLISIRAFLLKRQTLPGKLGQSFRELITLMENLEN